MIDGQLEEREAKITEGGWRLCGEGFEYIIVHVLNTNLCTHKRHGAPENVHVRLSRCFTLITASLFVFLSRLICRFAAGYM